jgi:folylpolyglutamate synthase/dihydropteroate synthase
LPPHRETRLGGAREAAEAFAGHAIAADPVIQLEGRLERRPGEIRDGAHNPAGARWLVESLPSADYTIVCSILADKDADEMLAELARVGKRLVATQSSNARALPAVELAQQARLRFTTVEAVADPIAALARAHELGEPVLVTGSLYLLADLAGAERGGAAGARRQ